MGQGKNSFKHQSMQDPESIRDILKSVTRGLGKGELTFSDGDGEIQMHPEGLLRFKLSAKQEEGRNRIDIRIIWQEQDMPGKKSKSLTVSSD